MYNLPIFDLSNCKKHMNNLLCAAVTRNSIKYKGCYIFFLNGKYKVYRKRFNTLDESKKEVDRACEAIGKSIVK